MRREAQRRRTRRAIALRDVRGLDPQAEQEVITWAARALTEAATKEE
ncbi:hypothetical protein [Nonomuraea rhodomycinica]|uniref:Uncharacterized protein n=1 Tax=Nonomuraea rhodomycinica TaxID=1712872 RepID=A0A7Y6IMX4_9ACTN|nr:hypothetical protein [Nonomuraea rhodomycinica]NUW41141.1 hypothetical protein [Nonomuraea rhodomycinica]